MGKNALHGRVELVEGMGDCLAAPLLIAIYRAQVVSPHDNAIEWA